MLLMIVKADTNDADYITQISEVTQEELEKLKPIFKAIKNFPNKYDYNWPCNEWDAPNALELAYEGVLTPDQVNHFRESYVPYGENGVDTIKSIEVLEVINRTRYV